MFFNWFFGVNLAERADFIFSMELNRKFFIIIGVVASALIIFLYVFSVPKSADVPITISDPPNSNYTILDGNSYPQTVSLILNDLISGFNVGDTEALVKSKNKLQELRVSADVKEDHLILFSALDIWITFQDQVDMIQMVSDRLETFAEHQEWSKPQVQALLGQLAK